MPFRPVNDRHAIQEVVFAVGLQQPIADLHLKAMDERGSIWTDDLPQVERLQGLQIALPGNGVQFGSMLGSPLAGIRFSAFKRDGSLDWRLSAENNLLAVNCLTYTRWADVWERARRLLFEVSQLVEDQGNPVLNIGLQYIDLFVWEGDIAAYDAAGLFRSDSEMMPQSIWGRGPYWHLHQGWFEDSGLAAKGRLLRRMHIDAVDIVPGSPCVRVDTLLRIDLETPMTAYEALFESHDSLGATSIQELHALNKEMMLKVLTQEMADRIDLHA